jgi:hypothetical protein
MIATCLFTTLLSFANGQAAPKQVLYKLKLTDASGAVSNPSVRTLDGESAEIRFQQGLSSATVIRLKPRVNSDGTVTTDLYLEQDRQTSSNTSSQREYQSVFRQSTRKPMDFLARLDGKFELLSNGDKPLRPGDLKVDIDVSLVDDAGGENLAAGFPVRYDLDMNDGHCTIRGNGGDPARASGTLGSRRYDLELTTAKSSLDTLVTHVKFSMGDASINYAVRASSGKRVELIYRVSEDEVSVTRVDPGQKHKTQPGDLAISMAVTGQTDASKG